MMDRQIFRQTSLDHLSTPDQLDQVMRVTPPAAWLTLAAFFIFVGCGLVWSFIGTVPIRVTGRGILMSPGGVLDVSSSSQGRISKFIVHPGDWVDTGSVVAYLAQPELENQVATALAEAAEMQSQYNKIIEFQKHNLSIQNDYVKQRKAVLRQQLVFIQDRLKWLREREASDANLIANHLIARKSVVETKIQINAAEDEASNVSNELTRLELEQDTTAISKEKERIDQNFKITTQHRKVESLQEKLTRNQEVVSPYSGTIVEFKVNAGEVVDNGRALFSMLPQTQNAGGAESTAHHSMLVAELFVSPEDGKKIRPGMMAQISPSTVKREEYGFIEGTVTSVASIPSSEEGMMRMLKNNQLVHDLSGGGAPFEIVVELLLDSQTITGFKWSTWNGPETEINSGTLATGSVTVRNIHIIGLFLPSLEHLFERSAT